MSTISPAKQAQHVVDGQIAAVAFVHSLRAAAPRGDELTAIFQTHAYPLAEESRLFMRGFLRQLQKTLEQTAQQKGGIKL